MSQAHPLSPIRRITGRSTPVELDLSQLRPLPTWFFAFEGVMAGAFDIVKINPNLLWVLGGLGAVNAVVSMTVLRRRIKMARAMLRNKRTRKIALTLVGLRLGAHLALNAAGAAITTPVEHAAMAIVMAAVTVALLRFDQKVTLRALTAQLTTPAQMPTPAVAQV